MRYGTLLILRVLRGQLAEFLRQPHGRADGQLEPAIVAGPLAAQIHILLFHTFNDVWQERTGQAG